jgi:hypothetical protein
LADEQTGRGHRVSFRHRFSPFVRTSASYTRASALGLPSAHVASPVFNESSVSAMMGRHDFDSFAAQIDAVIPRTRTSLTGLVNDD